MYTTPAHSHVPISDAEIARLRAKYKPTWNEYARLTLSKVDGRSPNGVNADSIHAPRHFAKYVRTVEDAFMTPGWF